ncbi:MAG: hypothetical protein VX641_00870 [Planctomycetota bacterium]|nr:hypothetical protein [Planctomycetota bacterium]
MHGNAPSNRQLPRTHSILNRDPRDRPPSWSPGPARGRRGVSRTGGLLVCLLLLAGGIWSVGCERCEERFCTGVRVVTASMMASASACCDAPDAPECDRIDERFEQFVAGLHAAYEACLDGNLDRLRDLLELIIRSLSRVFLIAFCEADVDLGDWMQAACHPYVNSSTPFVATDRIAADLGLRLDSGVAIGRSEFVRPSVGSDGVGRVWPGAKRYRFSEDSSVELDAWWGSGRFRVQGQLLLAPAVRERSGGLRHQVLDLALQLVDDTGHRVGEVAFNGHPAPGFARCSTRGEGMLGASVRIELAAGDTGLPDLADHARTVWMELPIRLRGRGGSLGAGTFVSAREVFPVDPAFAARLAEGLWIDQPPDFVFGDDESDFMPCEREDGLTLREWRWLQRMRQCFPQCFEGE